MSKSILVTGSNGQLGSELQNISAEDSEYDFFFADRTVLDLANTDAIKKYFDENSFDIIINCAAYTAVDQAESDERLANKINNQAVEALANAANENKTSLIHISTDYVFDGKNHRPYSEDDTLSPQGIYGQTKLDGEKALLRLNPGKSIIIRTSWVYSSFGNNFVKTMLRLGKDRDELGVIFDQVGTPTYAKDLAKTILNILPKLSNENVEVFHYSNEGVCSWYDFAKAIFELSEVKCRVNPIETREYPTPARRPHYSLLNKSKIKNSFDIEIPYWKESLKLCLETLKEEI